MTTDPEITSPADLQDQSVGIAPGTVTELLFPIYLELAGADPSTVEVVPIPPPDLIPALASGQVAAIEQFAMGQPTVAAAVGSDVRVLPYSDYLTDLYGVVLMTTPGLAESDPDLCTRFRDALLRGLQYSLDNPQDAGEILESFVPEQDAAVAAQELEIMRSYSLPSVGPLGTIDPDKVMRSIALLQSLGVIDAATAMEPDDLVAFDLVPAEES
jgi:NitT/TauT family transport system substrate-binding protein